MTVTNYGILSQLNEMNEPKRIFKMSFWLEYTHVFVNVISQEHQQ